MARRYGQRIYGIEIWNEPWITSGHYGLLPNLEAPNQPIGDWRRLARIYSRILAAAREAVKSVEPNLKIIGPGWANPTSYFGVTEELAKDGGFASLDGFSFHDYGDGGCPPDVLTPHPEPVMKPESDIVVAFRKSFPNASLPVFVDEIGLYGASALGIPNTGLPVYRSGISWHRGMCRAIKLVLLYRAAGVSALIPHIFCLGSGDPN